MSKTLNLQVSCICPTFNRAPNHLHLLEEAIASFLRQDYPHKELIVLNGTPGQHISVGSTAEQAGVRIYNSDQLYPTLGGKYDEMIEMATGDLILPWEDDDISLPWRISQAVARITLDNADYWNPRRQWYMPRGKLVREHKMGVCHNCSIFRKSAWREVGGYGEITGDQDAVMDRKLRQKGNVAIDEPWLIPKEWSYIYRWGVSPWHVSGKKPHQLHWDNINALPIQRGQFPLSPRWQLDYQQLCYELARSGKPEMPVSE